METTSNRFAIVKTFYIYLVLFATLMILTFSGASIINNVLKMTVFTKADAYFSTYAGPGCDYAYPTPGVATSTPEQCEKMLERNRKNDDENRVARRQDSLVFGISMFVVALPLFLIHWKLMKKQE